jgi:SAM-dependent methyltransferase
VSLREATPSHVEPGSFRDPDSRVCTRDGRVFRLLSERGAEDWRKLCSSQLHSELASEAKLVRTWDASGDPLVADLLGDGVAGVLEHEAIPFVSYPYEWSFSMLQDAALLQLELVRRSIDAGMILKDSSPYNVQFVGPRPIFIDVGSFESLREGEPWAGYRQFCMLFLYPLLLQAWKGIPFQPWLRGSLAGITPRECRSLLSSRDRFRRGTLTHVALHARFERGLEDTDSDVRGDMRKAGFKKELIVANVRGLERLVARLRPPGQSSAWSGYEPTTSYTAGDAESKAAFVTRAVTAESPRLVWDLGCNDGRFSRIAAEVAEHVVAVDSDAAVVDRLYRELRAEGDTTILPLVLDLTDPSPGLGWRGLERKPLEARGRPDLALCLALVHHVSIGGNVPIAGFFDWLRDLDTSLVVEFPTPEDPMVKRMLGRKREADHHDYRRDWFERCLEERFLVERTEVLASGARVLYHARPRR